MSHVILQLKIDLNLNQQEVISFLKKNVVKLKNKSPFGLIQHTVIWYFIARFNANNIKRDMIASFEEQLKNSVVSV